MNTVFPKSCPTRLAIALALAMATLQPQTTLAAPEDGGGDSGSYRARVAAMQGSDAEYRELKKQIEQGEAMQRQLEDNLQFLTEMRNHIENATRMAAIAIAGARDKLENFDALVLREQVVEIEKRIKETQGIRADWSQRCQAMASERGSVRDVCEAELAKLDNAIGEMQELRSQYLGQTNTQGN